MVRIKRADVRHVVYRPGLFLREVHASQHDEDHVQWVERISLLLLLSNKTLDERFNQNTGHFPTSRGTLHGEWSSSSLQNRISDISREDPLAFLPLATRLMTTICEVIAYGDDDGVYNLSYIFEIMTVLYTPEIATEISSILDIPHLSYQVYIHINELYGDLWHMLEFNRLYCQHGNKQQQQQQHNIEYYLNIDLTHHVNTISTMLKNAKQTSNGRSEIDTKPIGDIAQELNNLYHRFSTSAFGLSYETMSAFFQLFKTYIEDATPLFLGKTECDLIGPIFSKILGQLSRTIYQYATALPYEVLNGQYNNNNNNTQLISQPGVYTDMHQTALHQDKQTTKMEEEEQQQAYQEQQQFNNDTFIIDDDDESDQVSSLSHIQECDQVEYYDNILYGPITAPTSALPSSFITTMNSIRWQILYNDILTYMSNVCMEVYFEHPQDLTGDLYGGMPKFLKCLWQEDQGSDLKRVIKVLGQEVNTILTRDYYAALVALNAHHDNTTNFETIFPRNYMQQEVKIESVKPLLFFKTKLALVKFAHFYHYFTGKKNGIGKCVNEDEHVLGEDSGDEKQQQQQQQKLKNQMKYKYDPEANIQHSAENEVRCADLSHILLSHAALPSCYYQSEQQQQQQESQQTHNYHLIYHSNQHVIHDIHIKQQIATIALRFIPYTQNYKEKEKVLIPSSSSLSSNYTDNNISAVNYYEIARELYNNPSSSCISHLFPLIIDFYSHCYLTTSIRQSAVAFLQKSDLFSSFLFYHIYYRRKYQYENDLFHLKRLIDFQALEQHIKRRNNKQRPLRINHISVDVDVDDDDDDDDEKPRYFVYTRTYKEIQQLSDRSRQLCSLNEKRMDMRMPHNTPAFTQSLYHYFYNLAKLYSDALDHMVPTRAYRQQCKEEDGGENPIQFSTPDMNDVCFGFKFSNEAFIVSDMMLNMLGNNNNTNTDGIKDLSRPCQILDALHAVDLSIMRNKLLLRNNRADEYLNDVVQPVDFIGLLFAQQIKRQSTIVSTNDSNNHDNNNNNNTNTTSSSLNLLDSLFNVLGDINHNINIRSNIYQQQQQQQTQNNNNNNNKVNHPHHFFSKTEILIIIHMIYILHRLYEPRRFDVFRDIVLYNPRLPSVLSDLYTKSQQIWSRSTCSPQTQGLKVAVKYNDGQKKNVDYSIKWSRFAIPRDSGKVNIMLYLTKPPYCQEFVVDGDGSDINDDFESLDLSDIIKTSMANATTSDDDNDQGDNGNTTDPNDNNDNDNNDNDEKKDDRKNNVKIKANVIFDVYQWLVFRGDQLTTNDSASDQMNYYINFVPNLINLIFERVLSQILYHLPAQYDSYQQQQQQQQQQQSHTEQNQSQLIIKQNDDNSNININLILDNKMKHLELLIHVFSTTLYTNMYTNTPITTTTEAGTQTIDAFAALIQATEPLYYENYVDDDDNTIDNPNIREHPYPTIHPGISGGFGNELPLIKSRYSIVQLLLSLSTSASLNDQDLSTPTATTTATATTTSTMDTTNNGMNNDNNNNDDPLCLKYMKLLKPHFIPPNEKSHHCMTM